MNIKVIRDEFTDACTIGQLSIDDVWQCYTLELPTPESWPGTKGYCCVPLGKYQLTLSSYKGEVYNWMVKLVPDMAKYGVPWISNIKGVSYPDWTTCNDGIPTEGIEADRHVYIHIGNTKEDTQGCLLVGLSKSKDRINQSTDAFKKVYKQIVGAINNKENVTIEYVTA